jgi:hypothetical protein
MLQLTPVNVVNFNGMKLVALNSSVLVVTDLIRLMHLRETSEEVFVLVRRIVEKILT